MTRKLPLLLAVSFLAVSVTPLIPQAHAEPGGCLKYGAAGAVAGHIANKHGVLGAVSGCAVGMYQRHKYRKSLKEKAALWDKEHSSDKNAITRQQQNHNDKAPITQKAQWYDTEHPDDAPPTK